MAATGWVGDWSTFQVGSKYDMCMQRKSDTTVVEQALADVTRPIFFRISAGLAVLLPGRLDKARLLHAAESLISAYPVLGARLRPTLAGLPVLDIEDASFTLTFATWDASAEDFWQASQWGGAAAGMFLASSPLFSDVQGDQVMDQQAPLFSLRVTELRDGSCVLAASFLHILADGMRIVQALKDLAAAYTGRRGLPAPHVHRVGSAAELAYAAQAIGEDVPEALLDPSLFQPIPQAASNRVQEALNTEEGHFARMADFNFVLREPPAQLPELDRIVNFVIAEEDILSLRQKAMRHPAVRALPGGYISRNDIVVAIAWVLGCDMHQRCRPGYAVAGTANVALLVLDLVENDLDGKLTRALVPPGAMQNIVTVLAFMVPACEQPAAEDASSPSGLHNSIGLAAAACRAAILQARSPGRILGEWAKQVLAAHAEPQTAPAYDCFVTNWNQLKGYKDIDFGHGSPLGLTGTCNAQQTRLTAVIPAPQGPALRLAVNPGMLSRLKASPVLGLLPASGLMSTHARSLLCPASERRHFSTLTAAAPAA